MFYKIYNTKSVHNKMVFRLSNITNEIMKMFNSAEVSFASHFVHLEIGNTSLFHAFDTIVILLSVVCPASNATPGGQTQILQL